MTTQNTLEVIRRKNISSEVIDSFQDFIINHDKMTNSIYSTLMNPAIKLDLMVIRTHLTIGIDIFTEKYGELRNSPRLESISLHIETKFYNKSLS